MSDSIITGVFTLSGALLGGLITYLAARDTKKIIELRKQINILSRQIISYWNLEKIYSENLSNLTNKSSVTILKEYRDEVVSMDLDRPSMTANEAIKILTKNE